MRSEEAILDADLLRAFAVFAETMSFTRAARLVHLSQPALFERVQRLAERLDAPLYERHGRVLRLTEAGRRVAAFARDELARAGAFLSELRGERETGSVTLAAGEGTYLYLLGPALKRFASSGHALRLLTLGAADAIEAVRSGAADLAVTIADLVPPQLVAEDVRRVRLCAALPARHRLARSPRVRLEDLSSERLVLAPSGRLYRDLVARFLAKGGAELQPPLEADGWPLMLAFVQAGLGVAVVNGSCVPPRGVVLRPLPELGTVTYRLLRRRGTDLAPPVLVLARAVRELAGR